MFVYMCICIEGMITEISTCAPDEIQDVHLRTVTEQIHATLRSEFQHVDGLSNK